MSSCSFDDHSTWRIINQIGLQALALLRKTDCKNWKYIIMLVWLHEGRSRLLQDDFFNWSPHLKITSFWVPQKTLFFLQNWNKKKTEFFWGLKKLLILRGDPELKKKTEFPEFPTKLFFPSGAPLKITSALLLLTTQLQRCYISPATSVCGLVGGSRRHSLKTCDLRGGAMLKKL